MFDCKQCLCARARALNKNHTDGWIVFLQEYVLHELYRQARLAHSALANDCCLYYSRHGGSEARWDAVLR